MGSGDGERGGGGDVRCVLEAFDRERRGSLDTIFGDKGEMGEAGVSAMAGIGEMGDSAVEKALRFLLFLSLFGLCESGTEPAREMYGLVVDLDLGDNSSTESGTELIMLSKWGFPLPIA